MIRWGILTICLLLTLASADVSLSLREASGRSVFERNSSYLVTLQAGPTIPTTIGAIGEIYLEYDPRVFVPLTGINTDYQALPHPIWDSEKINMNHSFADPGYTCMQYAKTDNNGVGWRLTTTQNIFTVRFRVKPGAPTGNTSIHFIYTPDFNRTKMIDIDGQVIPIICQDLSLFIDLDRTPPTTVLQPNGGLFNKIPQPRINISEDGIVHYQVVTDGLGSWAQETVSENLWSSVLAIPGVPGQVKRTAVNYYGEDFALDKPHNVEVLKSAQFIIDMEPPTITNVKVPTSQIPVNATVEVWFNAFDQVAIGSTSLTIGGKPATFIGQSGVDNHYVYRRIIDGTEDVQGRVFITATDTAGNVTTDNSKLVRLDFAGPYFYNITTSPVMPQINQETIISFSASEELNATPHVQIGPNFAEYLDNTGLDYHYKYVVTGNGWYIGLVFDKDTNAPFTERNLSPKFTGDRPINGDVVFRVADSQSSINIGAVRVIVNNLTVYLNGSFINGYTGRIFYNDGKPNFVCIPPTVFPNNQPVTVQVQAADTQGNTTNEIYTYVVATYNDTMPPTIDNKYPAPSAVSVSVVTPVYFRVYDFNQCGAAYDRVNVKLGRVIPGAHNNRDKEKDKDGDGFIVTESVSVVVNGAFQPGFSGALEQDLWGNLIVTIIPDNPLRAATTYNCYVSSEDFARITNTVSTSWNFKTLGTTDVPDEELNRIPLAWPTVFNPKDTSKNTSNKVNKQYLTFSVPEDGDITIRMYDLSGDMIWDYKYLAKKGFAKPFTSQEVYWDAHDARGRLVGNGPYIWYIIQGHKVIGRGTAVVMY